jgi:hypothetical protein
MIQRFFGFARCFVIQEEQPYGCKDTHWGKRKLKRDDRLSDFNEMPCGAVALERPCLLAFDLIEHQGNDLRDLPLLYRKKNSAKCSARRSPASNSPSI